MAISTLSDYASALKQQVVFTKTPGNSNQTYTCWASSGVPAAGSLAIGNTANGVVPTNTTTGAPSITAFSGSGYITKVEALCVATAAATGRAILYDRLFHAGSYAFNASTTLTSQPSYSSRVPGGTDYTGTQIWIETTSTFSGSAAIAVTYTNQSGATGHTTGTVTIGATVSANMVMLPLQSGDSGVQKIESVTATVASAGAFNVVVARPLWTWWFSKTNESVLHPLEVVGMPQIWQDSCLALIYFQHGSGAPNPLELYLEVASA